MGLLEWDSRRGRNAALPRHALEKRDLVGRQVDGCAHRAVACLDRLAALEVTEQRRAAVGNGFSLQRGTARFGEALDQAGEVVEEDVAVADEQDAHGGTRPTLYDAVGPRCAPAPNDAVRPPS